MLAEENLESFRYLYGIMMLGHHIICSVTMIDKLVIIFSETSSSFGQDPSLQMKQDILKRKSDFFGISVDKSEELKEIKAGIPPKSFSKT